MTKDLSTQRLQKVQTEGTIETMQEAIDYLKRRKARKFTAQDIRELRLFPWATSDRSIVKIIEQDAHFGENILRTQIYGEGRQRRYYIRGSHLIRFIEKYGPVLNVRIPKPKQHAKKQKTEAKEKGHKSDWPKGEEEVDESDAFRPDVEIE